MKIRATEFLRVFREPDEPLDLRAFKPKKVNDTPENAARKYTTTITALESDRQLQAELLEKNKHCGLYFVVNAGGHEDKDIKRFTAWFVENDSIPIAEQHDALDHSPIKPSIRVVTRSSVHAYWPVAGDCSAEDWREIQEKRLIPCFKSDPKIKNPSRVMRAPGFNHIHVNGNGPEYQRVTIHTFEPEKRYTVAEMKAAFPVVEQSVTTSTFSGSFEYHEDRNAELTQRIMARGKRNSKGNWDARAMCHGGTGDKGLVYFPASGAVHCNAEPSCDYFTILRAEGLPDGHLPSRERAALQSQSPEEEAGSTDTKPVLTGFAEFMDQPEHDGEVIAFDAYRGEVVLFQSVTNSGKSTSLRNAALCMASGRPFPPLYAGGEPLRVGLLDFEGAAGRLRQDLRVMQRVFSDDELRLIAKNLFPTHAPELDDEPLTLSNPIHRKLITSELRALKVDVIVIDTLMAGYSVHSENDNAEIACVMKNSIRLARELNCVVVKSHHIGKAKAEGGETAAAVHRGRGASSAPDFASAVFNLELDQATNLVTLTCAKRKSGTGECYESVLRLDRDSRWLSPTSEAPPRPLSNKEQVLGVLSHTSLPTAGVEQKLRGKMSDRTVRNCLKQLVDDGLVTQPRRGYWALRDQSAGQRELENDFEHDDGEVIDAERWAIEHEHAN